MGDFNKDTNQLATLFSEPGASTLADLQVNEFGPTNLTRVRSRQRQRQIDHILTDFDVSNPRKLK